MVDYGRIKQCMKKAQEKQELHIGFLGGSITQGSLATKDTLTYAYRVFRWWEENYPDTAFHYINGGIGGTNSHFGVARAVEDLLMYQPDFVIVDFSVNDEEKDGLFFQETYEGVIRKILKWPSKPAVIVLNNVYYDTGKNMQKLHNEIADYYGIPHVSIKDTIYEKIQKGIYCAADLTPDNLHPNDRGHELIAGEICKLLDKIKNMSETIVNQAEQQTEQSEKELAEMQLEQLEKKTLPKPMTQNQYEETNHITIRNSNPFLDGFLPDTREKQGHLDFFKNGWIGRKVGDRICFQIEASSIAIQYRKTINQPAPVARVVIDGQKEKEILLDSNFEEDWGDCLYLEKLIHHGERKQYSIEIEIIKASEEDKSPFYLLSLITA